MGDGMRHSTASGLGFMLMLAATGLLMDSFSREKGPRAKWLEVLLLVVGSGLVVGTPGEGCHDP